MSRIRVLVLRSAGANCDLETEHAWRLAGAEPQRVHIGRLIENPALLDAYQILTIPGGFSYGDDIAAGTILSARLTRYLSGTLRDFVERGSLVLGICNGFQVLVKAGLLPGDAGGSGPRSCTIAHNRPAGFQARWVCVEAQHDRCAFFEAGRRYELPIAHGEGRVVFASPDECERAVSAGHGVARYARSDWMCGTGRDDPVNPNGSEADIAALCDATGRVAGLMPHPERFVTWTQHPCWTSLPRRDADGLAVFERAVAHLS